MFPAMSAGNAAQAIAYAGRAVGARVVVTDVADEAGDIVVPHQK